MPLSTDFASLAFAGECYFHNAMTMDMERSDEREQEADENGRTEERDEATRPCIALEFDGLNCFETIVSH
ncbi:Cysteine proteinase inhibitor [Psidium guajava]|nr:Cysteine proteinase inhibitor [Psidium guajava]